MPDPLVLPDGELAICRMKNWNKSLALSTEAK